MVNFILGMIAGVIVMLVISVGVDRYREHMKDSEMFDDLKNL